MKKLINILFILCVSSSVMANSIAVKGSLSSPVPQPKVDAVIVDKELPPDAGISEFHPKPKYDTLKNPTENDYRTLQNWDANIPAFLALKTTQSKRLIVLPDGKIRFLVSDDSFISNIKILMSHTYGKAYFPSKFPQGMRLYNEFYLYGDSVLDIIDQLAHPFGAKYNVEARVWINNIVSFSYNGAE
ncbi:hypothetical protein [Vibrio cholerae]|uniref:hypothetical protein n=1 Tax=Vibrio cholerae TaxID=666 RepID=UPI001A1C5CD1|nr:hypothetical protein [Vibrio cholerae]MBY4641924.1 hypothetical protein [Vibrio cholerae]MCR9658196.1 hypothetical protein [Vibrio cholerae]MCR9688877.1 hypothetical protein [Vibrio cholerae]MCR9737385.1 hypothetical protein [Vibrio cholerae]MCR9746208.1 hypothetical protein [Vibrio cholerae]